LNDRGDVDLSSGGSNGSRDCESNNVNSDFFDGVGASISWISAESGAVRLGGWALLPADGSNTMISSLARSVAESCLLLKAISTDHKLTEGSSIRLLCAGNTDIGHSAWAVWRTDTACYIVEASSAFGVPDKAPFLASKGRIVWLALILLPEDIADASSVRCGLVAESSVISESWWTVLPADWSDSVEVISAFGVAEKSVLFPTILAGGNDLSNSSAIGILPAVAGIGNGSSKSDNHSDGNTFHIRFIIIKVTWILIK
jgi:hypothetical protein